MYKIEKGLIVQKIGEKTVIFDGEKSILYTFNETAGYIFHKLKAKWEDGMIVKSLVKRYGITEKRAQKDFSALVAEMKKKKILSSFPLEK